MHKTDAPAFADALAAFRASAHSYQFELTQEQLEREMRRDTMDLNDLRVDRELREPKT